MINRFRNFVLDIIGAYDDDYIRGDFQKKPMSKKKLSQIKKESKIVKVEKNIISKKQIESREINEDFEVDNVMMKLNPEIPQNPKKYVMNKVYTEEEKLLYRFRFINYTEESFDQLRNSLKNGLSLPDKFEQFGEYLHMKNGRIYFKNMPVLRQSEIQTLCRNTWFDPTKPVSPDKIYQLISSQGANLSRSKVRRAVQSIEEYQRHRGLRRPKKVEANFFISHSNTIVCDMFFINKWKFFNVCEAFSGYIKTYYIKRGTAIMIRDCVKDFLSEISKINPALQIKYCLCDQGTENQKIKETGLKVVFMKVAQPMHLAEFMNHLVCSRLKIYLDLSFDPSEILELVLQGLNSRKRKRRNHFTPIELLKLDKITQKRISENIVYATPREHYNLKKIYKGSFVRILELSRKDQLKAPMSYKSYNRKWSEEVYQVSRIKRVKGTLNVFKYVIMKKEYFRNEILLIPKMIDKKIPNDILRKPFAYPREDDDDSSGIYVPSDGEISE